MALNPASVLTDAIRAVPSLKYGLGVAGVVAAGMMALGLANDRPQLAVLTFVFVLAGMFLLAIFVSAAMHLTGEMLTRPLLVIVWALTLIFVGLVLAFFSGFVFGKPEAIARFVGVVPASVREPGNAGGASNKPPATAASTPSAGANIADSPTTAVSPPATVPVSMSFTFRDSDNNCDSNRIVPVQWCLPQVDAKLKSWSGPSIQSANCGSQFENVRKVGEKCLAVDARIKGCGYDNLIVARNCRGSGWLDGTFVLEGEAPAP